MFVAILKKSLSVGLLVFFTAVQLQAQLNIERYVLASSGNDTTVGNLSISYTVGELAATETFVGNSGTLILTQGFQQHDDILLSLEDDLKILLDYQIAPNPVKDILSVKLSTDKPIELELSLYNMLGQDTPVPSQKQMVGSAWSTTFDMNPLPEGYYLLALKNADGAVLRTFNIQKID